MKPVRKPKNPAADLSSSAIQSNLRKIERREWLLWTSAIFVTLLLTLAVASFVLPMLHVHRGGAEAEALPMSMAVRGLAGIVLLFDVYTVYQQLQIHRIRRQLMEREELFRLISENAADLIAVVDMDGRRIYNSMAYQKVLGYSPEELKGSSSLGEVHPDDRPRVMAAAAEARKTGVGANLEYRIRHKDGTWRVLESTSSVILNEKGVPSKLVIVNRDITERKRASDALRLSEGSFRSMIENAPYGIYRATAAGQLLRVNPALQKMLGYDSAVELLKMNLARDLYSEPQQHQRIIDLLATEKGFKDVEVEWTRKDGSLTK